MVATFQNVVHDCYLDIWVTSGLWWHPVARPSKMRNFQMSDNVVPIIWKCFLDEFRRTIRMAVWKIILALHIRKNT